MPERLRELIRQLMGRQYALYSLLQVALGVPTPQQFNRWWRLIPPANRRMIKVVWRRHCNARGKSAYWLYRSLTEYGAISRKQFDEWWDLVPGDAQLRLKLCWWAFLRRGCAAVEVKTLSTSSILRISLSPAPDSPSYYL